MLFRTTRAKGRPMSSITPQSVSAHLKRLGFRGISTDRKREGIRVKRGGLPDTVSITADYDSDSMSTRRAESLEDALVEAGYTVVRTEFVLRVTRPAP